MIVRKVLSDKKPRNHKLRKGKNYHFCRLNGCVILHSPDTRDNGFLSTIWKLIHSQLVSQLIHVQLVLFD